MSLHDDIERLAACLENELQEEEAYFAIFHYSGEMEESGIQATALGLQRFAAQLLKASLKVDEVIADEAQSTIPLNPDEQAWIGGDLLIDYIEPVTEKPEEVVDDPDVDVWQGRAIAFGCLSIILFTLFLVIVGVITLIRWVF